MAAMHTALQSVVKYFNFTKESAYVNDVRLSQVQYKVVFGALVTCAILSGLTSWYSRIDCAVPDTNLAIKRTDLSRYVEEWCYANSTFLVKEANNGYVVGNQYSSTSEEVFRIGYYQWVTIALLIQAACFQIPRLLWKGFEGDRVRKLFANLAEHSFSEDPRRTRAIQATAKYFIEQYHGKAYRHYFNYFALCQCLYFINTLSQICFTQTFLENEFLNLLPSFVRGSSSWNQAFPKIVKCNFLLNGPTGSPQTFDVLCVLAMNVLFEKLYLLVWIILAVSLIAAIAQNVLVFMYILSTSSVKADKKVLEGPSERLLLRFLRLSLDRTLYDALIQEINRQETAGV